MFDFNSVTDVLGLRVEDVVKGRRGHELASMIIVDPIGDRDNLVNCQFSAVNRLGPSKYRSTL